MALDIWGRVIADYSDDLIAEAAQAARVRGLAAAQAARLDAQDAARVAPTAPATPRTADPPPNPAPANIALRLRSAARSSDAGLTVNTDPADILARALDAAPDDATRARVLQAAPKHVRDGLTARLQYQALIKDAPDECDEFERALTSAQDDAARTALFAGRDAKFLAEWAFRQRATEEDWRRRYLELTAEPVE